MAGPLSAHTLAAAPVLTDGNRVLVWIIAAVALAALGLAAVLVRQVLAADEGSDRMKKIAAAVQEGANAYLARQFRTLGIFAVAAFFLLMLLPADNMSQRIGRSIFFLVGAVFSAVTGYIGMWLAVRSNVRVAAAPGRRPRPPVNRPRISPPSPTGRCGSPSGPAEWSACSPSASDCSARPPSF